MKTVIASTTFYRGIEEVRFRLACRMVEKAVAAGHIVVIVDASPIPEVAVELAKRGALVYGQQHKGMGPGRREIFFHAREIAISNGAGIIVWTEPEKEFLIEVVPAIIRPIEFGEDIVIPRRSESSMKTWPEFQQGSEKEANFAYNEIFGLPGFDPMFGPVAFRVEMATFFIDSDGRIIGVDDAYIQLYAPLFAWRKGAHVVSVEVNVSYPLEQREEEETQLRGDMLKKRKCQLDSLKNAWRKIGERLNAV